MKQLSSILLSLLTLSAWAQPVVLPSAQVEFSFRSNSAKQVSVYIAGKQYSMTADGNGVFRCVTDTLPADFYTYTFNVDGTEMLDPQNLQTARDCNRLFSSLVVATAEDSLMRQNDVPHGTVEQAWYQTSDGKQHAMSVYLPPTYYNGKHAYYPTLFLMHGTGGDELAWLELGRAAQILDNLIAEGKAKEMIVVMPNCNMWQQAAPSRTGVAEDWSHKTLAQKTANGRFEEEAGALVSQVERTYRSMTRKNQRAIAGLSRGGYYAFHISHFYNQMFDYVGIFSATYFTNSPSRIYKNVEKDLARQFKTPPALYYIAIGNSDFLYEENIRFRQMLDQAGYTYIYKESDGGHEWRNWRKYLADFLQCIF